MIINSKANQLAHYLIRTGIKDVQIGISLSRSENIIIAILGILKAGCAYVFLDPQYPAGKTQLYPAELGYKAADIIGNDHLALQRSAYQTGETG